MHLTLVCPEEDVAGGAGSMARFAHSFAAALTSRGCSVSVISSPADGSAVSVEGGAILLCSDQRPPRVEAAFRVLWLLGCPRGLETADLAGHDLILSASALHADLLAGRCSAPVRAALPCTDFAGSSQPADSTLTPAHEREGAVLVADRSECRGLMAQWLAEMRTPARVFGRGWGDSAIAHLVEREHVAADELPALYQGAALGLVDHDPRHLAFGYMDPRVLDCLACGLPVVTEWFPVLREQFGEAVQMVAEADDLVRLTTLASEDFDRLLGRVGDVWAELGVSFSFDQRADQILGMIAEPPPAASAAATDRTALGQQVRASLTAGIDLAEQRMAWLEQRLDVTSRELARFRDGERVARIEASQQEQRAVAAEAERDAVRQELDAVLGSRSWRLTRFLRVRRRRLQEMLENPSGAGSGAAAGGGQAAAAAGDGWLQRWAKAVLPRAARARLRDAVKGITADSAAVTSPPGTLRRIVRGLLPSRARAALRAGLVRLGLRPSRGGMGHGTTSRRPANGGTPATGEPNREGARQQAGDARYWHLQAIPLLEEREHVHAEGPLQPQPGQSAGQAGTANEDRTRR